MARKKADEIEVDEEEIEVERRRRQSPKTRLMFALNNLLNALKDAELELPEIEAANTLLEDLGFERRESTLAIAQRIGAAIQSLDIMDDLSPMRTKKLGQLLGRAQRGQLITDDEISEAAGFDIEFVGDDESDSDADTADSDE